MNLPRVQAPSHRCRFPLHTALCFAAPQPFRNERGHPLPKTATVQHLDHAPNPPGLLKQPHNFRHRIAKRGDVMTAIVVRFEWHDDCPRLETGPPSYTLHSSPPTDRSVQRGREILLHLYMKI